MQLVFHFQSMLKLESGKLNEIRDTFSSKARDESQSVLMKA